MLTNNPFADLSATITPDIMQGYVIAMIVAVFLGTVLDMRHKKSAKYFFENSKKAAKNATRTLSGGEKASLAVATLANEVLTSSEFANPKRRMSHLMTMYGFIFFVVSTVALIFGNPTSAEAGIWPVLWHLGALSLALGGYWFWFFIRVDVASEGVRWYNFNGRGDLFIVGLLSTSTFALIWSATMNMFVFALFILSATVLFGTVFWSKFAHMFFKPAAAFQKRCIKADGSNENMPAEYDLTASSTQSKYPDIPEYMGTNPPNMGLGIKREAPQHF